jgi:GNAT superfamily N-acetyltransferase
MIRQAVPGEEAALEAVLMRQIDGAMFPTANLRKHGLGRGDFASDHDHASRFWWLGDNGLIALTRGGMLMPILDDALGLTALPAVLAGLTITGAVGPSASVRPVLAALGLVGLPTQLDRDEPGFGLDLDRLQVVPPPGALLAPLTESLRPMLVEWRAQYHGEVLGTPAPEATLRAAKDVAGYLATGSHRVLLLDGTPVAMTGFNAILPEIVQVGGVYTPPALRGRGHARLAVAMHLAEARANGVIRAVLFAANDAAASAYRSIGFQPSLAFALVLFSSPMMVAA